MLAKPTLYSSKTKQPQISALNFAIPIVGQILAKWLDLFATLFKVKLRKTILILAGPGDPSINC